MENTAIYLTVLLAGIIIGGVITALLASAWQRPYLPEYERPYLYGAAHPAYGGRPHNATTATIVFLLLLLGFLYLGLRQEYRQASRTGTMPAADTALRAAAPEAAPSLW